MIHLLLASFFYANVIYRIPVGSYGYVLASDVVSWCVISWALIQGLAGRVRVGRLDAFDYCLLTLNLLMILLLFQVYFEAHRVFSELGRSVADTLRFSQYILTYFAVRACLRTSLQPQRYLNWTFYLAVAVSFFGLLSDVIMKIPRNYSGITHDVLRPLEFSAFFTNNRACAAVYLLVAISIGFGFLLKRATVLRKGVVLSSVAMLALAVVFSRSRSGIAGLAVALLFFLYYDMRYRSRDIGSFIGRVTMVVVLGGAMLFALSSETVMDRVLIGGLEDISRYEYRADRIRSRDSKIATLSVKSRFENWGRSLEVIEGMSLHLPFGYGVNQQSARIGLGGAHNNFLQVIIDLGIVGVGLFLVLLRQISRRLKGPSAKRKLDNTQAIRLGLKCGFWGLVVTTLTQETFYMAPSLGNFFGFFLVIMAIVYRIPEATLSAAAGQEEEASHGRRPAHSVCC